jgi:hypothetical protein
MDVRAAYELCRQGEHEGGVRDQRIASFYAELTAYYPDQGSAVHSEDSPWASTPLHVAPDHLEMRLVDTCDDEVLLAVERLAAEHGLLLLAPQDGSVYPPPAPVIG